MKIKSLLQSFAMHGAGSLLAIGLGLFAGTPLLAETRIVQNGKTTTYQGSPACNCQDILSNQCGCVR